MDVVLLGGVRPHNGKRAHKMQSTTGTFFSRPDTISSTCSSSSATAFGVVRAPSSIGVPSLKSSGAYAS